jgi:hypothetical protein
VSSSSLSIPSLVNTTANGGRTPCNSLYSPDYVGIEYNKAAPGVDLSLRKSRVTLADLVRHGHSQSMVEASKNAFLQVS